MMVTKKIPCEASCMNYGDVYVLNAGTKVFQVSVLVVCCVCVLFFFLFFTSFSLSPPPLHLQWNGVDASPFERTAGIEVAAGLSDRQSATVVPAITGDLLAPGETHTNAQTLEFWSFIEGSPDTVQASVDDDDVASGVKSFSMYRLSDANTGGDVVEHTPVQTNVSQLDIDLLDPDDAYVIDAFKVYYIRAAAMSRSRANLLNPPPPLFPIPLSLLYRRSTFGSARERRTKSGKDP